MSKELIRIDASGKIPSRPKSTRRDPESRIALALEAGASQALPPVSELGFETALAAMADNSKAALAADLSPGGCRAGRGFLDGGHAVTPCSAPVSLVLVEPAPAACCTALTMLW